MAVMATNPNGTKLQEPAKEQAHYKQNFDAEHSNPRYYIPFGSYFYLRKELKTTEESKENLIQVVIGSFPVIKVANGTLFTAGDEEHEMVYRDRVKLASGAMDLA